MSYRPVRVDGWHKLSLDQLIWKVEDRLATFGASRAYERGERLHCTEAYLKGLEDARYLVRTGLVYSDDPVNQRGFGTWIRQSPERYLQRFLQMSASEFAKLPSEIVAAAKPSPAQPKGEK